MKSLRYIIITILAYIIVGIFALFTLNISFLNPIAQVVKDFRITDIYYQALQDNNEVDESSEIIIVDMSELYSRRELAKALYEIERAKPKVVGVDVVFEGLKDDSIGDMMIRNVSKQYENIVFSYKLLDYVSDSIGYSDAVHSFFNNEIIGREGFTNMERNLYGGMKRELSLGRKYQKEIQPSFITQVVGLYSGNDSLVIEDRNIKISFIPTRFKVIDYNTLKTNSDLMKDRIVLFGAMKEEDDMHYTPLGKMAGVELLAYSVQTIIHQSEVRSPSWLVMGIVSFLLVLITAVMLSRFNDFAEKRENRWIRFFFKATFTKSLLVFFWLAFLMWVAFILFYKYEVSFNMGWAFSAIAFLELARNIYDEFVKAYKTNRRNEEIVNDTANAVAGISSSCSGEFKSEAAEEENEICVETDKTVCKPCEETGTRQGTTCKEKVQ